MLRNRFLILLGGYLLASSAAWADEVGYVDCTNHPEEIQVFAKARRIPDLVATLPCGERFTVLVYGFVFSRVQTRDGKVGYIYSNLIAVDRAATAAQQAGSTQLASAKVKIPSVSAVTPPNQPAPAQSQPTAVQAAPAAAPASAAPETAAIVMQPAPPAPVEPVPTPAQPSPAVAPASPDPAPNAPETAASIVQPTRNTSSQPEASRVEPAAPAIRPADTRTSWEKPRPGGVRRAPLLELFGGYAFARLDGGGGTGTNVNGAMGSFGWNIKPWLQIVADTSYNTVTISGTKNILYGNHFGARYFHRGRNRWGLTPFAEALVGGSRADTKVSGSSTYNTSQNCLSYKVGGGLDIHPFRHIDIRLFDADYYRTSFGTNAHQNNYWISTGIVIRLFGGGSE
ncbi:MAG: hypothetical protein DMG44_12145 [Acidobacteria bacterium]|nr:MAG: hypothetical protein DMG44_12145 [Acidobacteriota bacterium]